MPVVTDPNPYLSQTPLDFQIVNVDYNMEFLWSNFEIPWSEMPQELVTLCEQGKKSMAAITDIVHFVINELRQIKELIPSKVLTTVAAKMAQKYPKMFIEVDDDGVPLGDGSSKIFCKLYERAAYLRRPHKRKSRSDLPVGPKMKKKKANIMAGCSNLAPQNHERNTGHKENDKKKLNELYDKLSNDNFLELMEITYVDNVDVIKK